MHLFGILFTGCCNFIRNFRRQNMLCHSVGIFGFIIIETAGRPQLRNGISPAFQTHNRQLPTGNIFFNQDFPVRIIIPDFPRFFRRFDDKYPDGRSVRNRLNDIRQRNNGSLYRQFPGGCFFVCRRLYTLAAGNLLGQVFIHTDNRRLNTGMSIRNLQQIKHSLNGAVLTPVAVQTVKHDIGLFFLQNINKIPCILQIIQNDVIPF